MNNTSGLKKWSYLNINFYNCYWCECLYILIWFDFTFYNYFCKRFYLTIAPIIPQLKFYKFHVLFFSPEKHIAAIANIFCKISEMNHKAPLGNVEFVFWFLHLWVLLKLLSQNKYICSTFSFWIFFCVAEVWHITPPMYCRP